MLSLDKIVAWFSHIAIESLTSQSLQSAVYPN